MAARKSIISWMAALVAIVRSLSVAIEPGGRVRQQRVHVHDVARGDAEDRLGFGPVVPVGNRRGRGFESMRPAGLVRRAALQAERERES